ncbi:MAG: zf-HC2 domain-containing protein, partial [Gemmatimonadetes bacterium]|nr:zf-HC2 domain-containing protein [Gemmatimonadota bacterium]
MMTHPSFAELNEYADRELSESRKARVSTHLAKCSACRRTIMSLRRIAKEAPGILNVGPPAGALERILDRHARGESVILPVADPPRRVFVPAAMWRAAAVLALLAVSVATVFMVGELGAEFSELNLRVANSTSRTVEIEYRSTSMFADEDLLVVRARYRVPGDELSGAQNRKAISATLYRHDGRLFRGLLELPDSAVFAAFAVENMAGELVDSRGGELGEFLVEKAGIPLYDALVQKQQEWTERNGALALATARLATTLYPDNPEAWARVDFFEQVGAGEAYDRVRRAGHAARFAQFERDYAGKSLTDEQLAGTYRYAVGLGDADRLNHWRNRLLTEAPSHPTAVQAQVSVITERHRDRPDLALEQLEELWQAYGSVHPELPRNGFRQALKTGAPENIQRWADRRQAIEPWASVNIAMDLLQIPALKTNAMMRLRSQLAQWDADDRQNRALQSTAREDRLRLAALRRRGLPVRLRAVGGFESVAY